MRELIALLRGVPLDMEIVMSLEPGEKGFLVPIATARLAPVLRDREVSNPRWFLPARAAALNSEDKTEEFLIVLYPR